MSFGIFKKIKPILKIPSYHSKVITPEYNERLRQSLQRRLNELDPFAGMIKNDKIRIDK